MEVLEQQPVRAKWQGIRVFGDLWVRMRMGAKGRIVIPAAIRDALGMAEDDVLDMRVVDGELRIATMRERLRQAQERVKMYVPAGVSLADELNAERREEARRESAGF